MDTFREEVKKLLAASEQPNPESPAAPTTPSTGAIKKGDTVKIAADATYYSGKVIPSWVKAQNWIISEVSGDRAVIDKNVSGTNSICSPINTKFLIVVGCSTPAPDYDTYTVTNGDSLWAIAQKKLGNGERYTEIKSLNGLTSDTIYTGQKLKLPK